MFSTEKLMVSFRLRRSIPLVCVALLAAPWSRLRRAGVAGLVVIAADFLWRSAILYVLAAHLPESVNAKHMFIGTVDVFHVALALIFVALGQVQMAAAEIAGEHAQFV
jgi:hypothetical protein